MRMTREEAANILDEVKVLDDSMYQYNPAYLQALEMAIAALKAEPCEDCVSRKAVLDVITANCIWENEYNLTSSRIKNAVEKLPPVILKPTECEDAVSRTDLLDAIYDLDAAFDDNFELDYGRCYKTDLEKMAMALPPVTPKPLDSVLDEIRAEIEQEITYKPMEMWDYRMGLTKALEIINKYKTESEDKNR